tara:strand:- start:1 stop:333 length:333 start_codon:yes stop_codon:yes gene_type:complete
MPSYYDSTEKQPGKAKLKYEEGGKVKAKKVKAQKQKAQEEEEQLTEAQREALQKIADEEWRKKVDQAPTTKTTMGNYAKGGKVKKMSKGGQLKVRGMGAATRGGNFSRNG